MSDRPRRLVSLDEILRRFGTLKIEVSSYFNEATKHQRSILLRWKGDPDGRGEGSRHDAPEVGFTDSITIKLADTIKGDDAEKILARILERAIALSVRKMIETMSEEQTTLGQLILSTARKDK